MHELRIIYADYAAEAGFRALFFAAGCRLESCSVPAPFVYSVFTAGLPCPLAAFLLHFRGVFASISVVFSFCLGVLICRAFSGLSCL